jgi:hypothetical protein
MSTAGKISAVLLMASSPTANMAPRASFRDVQNASPGLKQDLKGGNRHDRQIFQAGMERSCCRKNSGEG